MCMVYKPYALFAILIIDAKLLPVRLCLESSQSYLINSKLLNQLDAVGSELYSTEQTIA